MSDYDKRYEVHVGFVSYYTDDEAAALRVYNGYMVPDRYNVMPLGGIYEGYAQESHSGDFLYRKNIGQVLISTLEYRIQRAVVQTLLERIK